MGHTSPVIDYLMDLTRPKKKKKKKTKTLPLRPKPKTKERPKKKVVKAKKPETSVFKYRAIQRKRSDDIEKATGIKGTSMTKKKKKKVRKS